MFHAGSGPPLVVIPGVQGRWEWLRPTLNRLQKYCTTVSYSLCGDFSSGWQLDPERGFDNYLEQLDEVFRRARLVRAAVCGISYGGFVALRYAATRPERVSALILVSSPPPGWKPTPIQSACIASPVRGTPRFVLSSPMRVWPELRARFDRPLNRIAFLLGYALRAARAPMNPPLMAARIVQQQQMDFHSDCTRVQAPTLVVTGEVDLDRIVPVENTRRYLELIPGARYAQLERTGHLGLVTRPETFASIVGGFVRETEKTQNYELRTMNSELGTDSHSQFSVRRSEF